MLQFSNWSNDVLNWFDWIELCSLGQVNYRYRSGWFYNNWRAGSGREEVGSKKVEGGRGGGVGGEGGKWSLNATINWCFSVASSRECFVDVGQCQIPLLVEGCHITDAIAAYPFRTSYPYLYKQFPSNVSYFSKYSLSHCPSTLTKFVSAATRITFSAE